jgi:small subunit ribosomal protein S4
LAERTLPKWLSFDYNNLKGSVVQTPERQDVDLEVKEHLIVELYSK